MYQNPYNLYNAPSLDRINEQINQLENMKKQMQQPVQPTPTNLTQNFQLAPTNRETIKYANSIDEVQRDMIIGDTPFFSRDMSVVWIKNTKGEIKTYELTEIIPRDEKDLMIENLQAQINELKGRIKHDEYVTDANTKQVSTDTTEYDDADGTAIKKNEPTNVQKISRSKTK